MNETLSGFAWSTPKATDMKVAVQQRERNLPGFNLTSRSLNFLPVGPWYVSNTADRDLFSFHRECCWIEEQPTPFRPETRSLDDLDRTRGRIHDIRAIASTATPRDPRHHKASEYCLLALLCTRGCKPDRTQLTQKTCKRWLSSRCFALGSGELTQF